ncbi:hypothetical protein [Mesorhizobium sp.]|uniref:hypothetical protein n=1 Tax=Mesorhizobium sp. TaxID=1871066 RepID=UPI000FE7069F|nr:hypothetical protein [Mesorhizobium sp.]RWA82635.1 MAG: hypothetical protein EOQ30_16390 [Mesorhizobium sp.]
MARAFFESAGADAGILNLAKGLVGAVRDIDPGVPHRRGFFVFSHRFVKNRRFVGSRLKQD